MQILLTSLLLLLSTMLDIRLLREQPDLVKARLTTRGSAMDDIIDALLTSDAKRRAVETSLQALQAERNRLSREIGALRSRGNDTAALEMRGQLASRENAGALQAGC